MGGMVVGWWALALACGGGSTAPTAPPASSASPVHVQTVAASQGSRSISLPGTLVAERSVELRPEASGLVAEVAFAHGQEVRRGQLLVRLVDADARAAVAEAEAREALARAQLERTRALADRQNASRSDLDRAQAEAALALAQLDRAREALRRTAVRAPFDGVVGLRRVVVGDLADPGRPVTTLVDLAALAVDVAVPERELGGLGAGVAAEVEVDTAPGRRFAGEVVFVAPRADEATRTFPARVALREADPLLRPGATARVRISGPTVEALRVPAQAVLTTARGPAVYVVDAATKAELRPIVAADRDEATVRVVEGLSAGERVVIDGLVRVRPGADLRVLE